MSPYYHTIEEFFKIEKQSLEYPFACCKFDSCGSRDKYYFVLSGVIYIIQQIITHLLQNKKYVKESPNHNTFNFLFILYSFILYLHNIYIACPFILDLLK